MVSGGVGMKARWIRGLESAGVGVDRGGGSRNGGVTIGVQGSERVGGAWAAQTV